jgi:hypothetical protein
MGTSIKLSIILTALCIMCGISMTSQAALHDRGRGLIYDDVLDITWVQDASILDYGGWGGIQFFEYDGFSDWRHPTVAEFQYMFYDNLGGTFGEPLTGDQGLFLNIQDLYWTNDRYYDTDRMYTFVFGYDPWYGEVPGSTSKADDLLVASRWPVRDGNVPSALVPEPVSSMFFIVGGVTLFGRRYLKKKKVPFKNC